MRRGYIHDIKGAKSHSHRLFFALLSFSLLMQHAMVSVLRALAQQSVDEMTSSLCVVLEGKDTMYSSNRLRKVFNLPNSSVRFGDDQSSVVVVSSLTALIEDQITKLRGNVRMVKGTDNLKAEDLREPPQILLAHPEVL